MNSQNQERRTSVRKSTRVMKSNKIIEKDKEEEVKFSVDPYEILNNEYK